MVITLVEVEIAATEVTVGGTPTIPEGVDTFTFVPVFEEVQFTPAGRIQAYEVAVPP
jgi:hypothetical protein